ncbi:MAG: hypothetical protein LBU06_02225 [Desulfovibrio sp.]|jgi:hypothetical protein|nr:hypothetical protein [Desulfovibrio sp.]
MQNRLGALVCTALLAVSHFAFIDQAWGTPPEEFLSEGRKSYPFCTQENMESDIYASRPLSCFYQRPPNYDNWLSEQGWCFSDQKPILDVISGFIDSVTIRNNYVIEGQWAVEYLLMISEAPCTVLLFNDNRIIKTNLGNIPAWKLALHLVYTLYGEDGAWPMPNVELQNMFNQKFGNSELINETHKQFLFNTWMEYIRHNTDNIQRWLPFILQRADWGYGLPHMVKGNK